MTPLPATEFNVTTGAAAVVCAAWLVYAARRLGALARGMASAPLDASIASLTASAPLALVIVWLVETRIGTLRVTGALAAALVTAVLLRAIAASRPAGALDTLATGLASLALLAATAILGWQALFSAI